ncbi:hypothetical protein BSKO_12448 [Bryopsis sp. KO-2023]|nr:hypothetical protein BSKO_12448 [Bryopsis sp. KO-2023]
MNVRVKEVLAALCVLAILPSWGIGQTTEDTNAFLDDCEAAGEKGAESVAKAACAVIKNKCPPSTGQPRTLFADTPDALVIEVVRKTCDLLFTTTCKNKAVDLMFDDPVCMGIITVGPGPGSEQECPNFDAAQKIFLEELEACNAEDLREQIEKQEAAEDEKDGKEPAEKDEETDAKPEKGEKAWDVCDCTIDGTRAPSLDDCEASGKTNGASGAKKACRIVKKKCAVKKQPRAAAVASKALSDQPLSLDEKLLIAVNRKSCRTLYQTSCKNQATTSAFDDPDCGDLISKGPIGGGTPDCPDADAAYKIFIDSLKICEEDPPELETSESDSEGGKGETPSPTPTVDPEVEPTPDSDTELFDDPCACTLDGVVGGVDVPIKGCQGLCYVVGGEECSDAKKSKNYDEVFWRLC